MGATFGGQIGAWKWAMNRAGRFDIAQLRGLACTTRESPPVKLEKPDRVRGERPDARIVRAGTLDERAVAEAPRLHASANAGSRGPRPVIAHPERLPRNRKTRGSHAAAVLRLTQPPANKQQKDALPGCASESTPNSGHSAGVAIASRIVLLRVEAIASPAGEAVKARVDGAKEVGKNRENRAIELGKRPEQLRSLRRLLRFHARNFRAAFALLMSAVNPSSSAMPRIGALFLVCDDNDLILNFEAIIRKLRT
jgi:hypothetical protein